MKLLLQTEMELEEEFEKYGWFSIVKFIWLKPPDRKDWEVFCFGTIQKMVKILILFEVKVPSKTKYLQFFRKYFLRQRHKMNIFCVNDKNISFLCIL